MPATPAATDHRGQPSNPRSACRTATTTETTSSPSPCDHATTAAAGRRLDFSPAKKSAVPQHALEARASSESMGGTLSAPARCPTTWSRDTGGAAYL